MKEDEIVRENLKLCLVEHITHSKLCRERRINNGGFDKSHFRLNLHYLTSLMRSEARNTSEQRHKNTKRHF